MMPWRWIALALFLGSVVALIVCSALDIPFPMQHGTDLGLGGVRRMGPRLHAYNGSV